MPKTDFQNEVVNRIRELRLGRGLSQIDLANIIDVSNGQIGNIESPKFRHKYTLKHLHLIATVFDTNMAYLLTGSHQVVDTDTIIQLLIKYDE